MSAGAIVAIIVAVAVVLLVLGALSVARRRKLQQRFGPEYDRVVGETHSHRKAGAELTERERRVRSLDIHPLEETARAKYAGSGPPSRSGSWTSRGRRSPRPGCSSRP